MSKLAIRSLLALCLLVTIIGDNPNRTVAAATDERYFPETGHSVVGKFLAYWDAHGGLAQFGYPISDEFAEVSDLDGKSYGVQYFERAEFEHHPENQPPYDVLLAQLGTIRYKQKYPNGVAGQQASTDHPYTFAETGMTIGGKFRVYWEQHGGLAQFGYPISNEFQEVSDLNGKPYTVQYFERAEFELHPENQPPYDVLLAQLGKFRYDTKLQAAKQPARLNLPYTEGHNQFGVKASGSYIVWVDQQEIGQRANTILSYNIRTTQLTTVTTMARDYVAIDGSTSVWEEVTNDNCNGCVAAIKGANLDTGQVFEVAPCASGGCFSPAIAGRTVVWREFENTSDKLFSKDLDSGTVTQIAFVTVNGNHYLERPLISDKYIVWADFVDNKRDASPFKINVYNRATGAVSVVGSFQAYTFVEQYALDGSHLLWTQQTGLYYTDLDTNQTRDLHDGWGVTAPAIRGDFAVWFNTGPGVIGYHIWGTKLDITNVVQLTTDPGDQTQPAIGGDLLLWIQSTPTGNGDRIVAAPIAQVFAAATGK
jgi:hypothetical protein